MILYPEDFEKTPVELQKDLQCYCPKCGKPHLTKDGFLYNPGYFKLCNDCFYIQVTKLVHIVANHIVRSEENDSDRSEDNPE